MTKRLSKYLASAGVASRRKCEELIFAGKVKVNGVVTKIPQTMVNSSVDKVEYDGEWIKTSESKVYYIINKPINCECVAPEFKRCRSVLDLFPNEERRLFTVGRLDKMTSGLLLVTNDGHFANKVIHPSSNLQKEYIAKTDKEITDAHLKELSKGVEVEGVWIKPVRVEKVRKGTVKVVVTDGKKREVRLLLEGVGLAVWTLKRVRIGNLRLGTLKEKEWRPMTEAEKEAIFQ